MQSSEPLFEADPVSWLFRTFGDKSEKPNIYKRKLGSGRVLVSPCCLCSPLLLSVPFAKTFGRADIPGPPQSDDIGVLWPGAAYMQTHGLILLLSDEAHAEGA